MLLKYKMEEKEEEEKDHVQEKYTTNQKVQ